MKAGEPLAGLQACWLSFQPIRASVYQRQVGSRVGGMLRPAVAGLLQRQLCGGAPCRAPPPQWCPFLAAFAAWPCGTGVHTGRRACDQLN